MSKVSDQLTACRKRSKETLDATNNPPLEITDFNASYDGQGTIEFGATGQIIESGYEIEFCFFGCYPSDTSENDGFLAFTDANNPLPTQNTIATAAMVAPEFQNQEWTVFVIFFVSDENDWLCEVSQSTTVFTGNQ